MNLIKQLVCLLVICTVLPVSSQNLAKKYIDNILNDSRDISKPRFLAYPTLAYAPETNFEIGLAAVCTFHAKDNIENRLSEIYGFTFFTLAGQYGLWFDNAIYTHQNKWFFLGKVRAQSFPLFYHGIGPNSPEQYQALVNNIQTICKQRVFRKILPNFYAGLEVDLQRLSNVKFINKLMEDTLVLPLGAEGSTNYGLGFGVAYDDRHNILNVRNGNFIELALLRYDRRIQKQYGFSSFILDSRIYRSIGKNNVIAAQIFGEFNTGNVPFNHLALLGGESLMRGYYLGRYRDKNQMAAQVEFRLLPLPLSFTERIGAAVFAGTGQVFSTQDHININNTLWTAGAGLRFLIFKNKDIWTRLDFALTKEGSGFYFFIGEAF